MNEIHIANRTISQVSPCFIIGDVGANFNGEYDLAIKLIDIAIEAGLDAVKFQTYTAKDLYIPRTKITSNLVGKVGFDDAYDLIESLEMPREWIPKLAKYAENKGIIFSSTPFDLEAVDILKPYVPYYKIAAPDLIHYPLLKKVARTGKPIVLSTGMAGNEDIKRAIDTCEKEKNDQIILLQCTSNYPTLPENLNLASMQPMGKRFKKLYGLSDHTEKNYHAFAAKALGASVIEKHFTFDKKAIGPDHAFALSPAELADLVRGIRSIERCMGSKIKEIRESERENFEKASRSLFFARDIAEGEEISEEDIVVNRPAGGLHPKHIEEIIGRKAKADIKKHTPITWGLI